MIDPRLMAAMAGAQGSSALGATPNAMASQAQQATQVAPVTQTLPPNGGTPGWLQSLQSPGMMGLLSAGTSMLGAAGRPGGIGDALLAGAQGGLGGAMMAQQAQKEDQRNRELMDIMKMQLETGRGAQQRGQGPMVQARQQPPAGLYGAY